MAVKLIQLKMGIALVAEVLERQDEGPALFDSVLLKNPVSCIADEHEKTIGFGKLNPFMANKQTIEMMLEDILFIAELVPEIENAYNANIGSGIVTATNVDVGALKDSL